jgi:hypothetical protein
MLWDLLFALSLLGVVKYGDYITDECPQAGYVCPKKCDVDHKHHPGKECQDAKRKRDIWKKSWKTEEKEKEEIEEYKDGQAKQESKSDTTTIQSVKQFHKEAVGTDKSEGL